MITVLLTALALADDTVNIQVRVTGGSNVTVTTVSEDPLPPPWVHPARWLAVQGVDDSSKIMGVIEPHRKRLDACMSGSGFLGLNAQVTVAPNGHASGPTIAQGRPVECMLDILTGITFPTNSTTYTVQYLYFAY